jgi:hypothetical protein
MFNFFHGELDRNVVGKNLSKEDKESVIEPLESNFRPIDSAVTVTYKDTKEEKIFEEKEKNQKQKDTILYADLLLKGYLEKLGLGLEQYHNDYRFDENMVHFLDSEHYRYFYIKEYGKEPGTSFATYHFFSRNILMDSDGVKMLSDRDGFSDYLPIELMLLLHEFVHASGTHSLEYDRPEKLFRPRRMGFSQDKFENADGHEGYRQLNLLNEAIVQSIALDALKEKEDVLKKKFSISNEDFDKLFEVKAYNKPIELLNTLVERVAESDDELTAEEYLTNLKRGHFTGEMMQLRKIENAIGKGMLRVFAYYSEEDVKLLSDKQVEQGDFQEHSAIAHDNMLAFIKGTPEEQRDIARRSLTEKDFKIFEFRNISKKTIS